MKTLLTFLTVVFIAFGPLHGQESKDYSMIPSNYFIGNSSFSLKKGQAYYANTLLLFNNFRYGLNNHITIGGGFGIVPYASPLWLNIKAAYPIVKNGLNVNVGLTSYNFIYDEPDFDDKGNITYHKRFSSIPLPIISFGLTLGNFRDNLSFNYYFFPIGSPLLNPSYFIISGKVQITPRTSFIMDNEIGISYLGIYGFRTAARRIIFDYGLMIFPKLTFDFDINLSEASPPPQSVERNNSGFQISFFPYLGLKVLIGKNW